MEESHNEYEDSEMTEMNVRSSIRKSRPFIDRNSLLLTSRHLLNKNHKLDELSTFMPTLSIEEEPLEE